MEIFVEQRNPHCFYSGEYSRIMPDEGSADKFNVCEYIQVVIGGKAYERLFKERRKV